MANQQRIHKSLAGQEDILYGEGEVSQERSGGTYPISKVRSIYPVNSLAELEALDSDKFPKAALYEDDGITYYVYNTDTSQYEVTASSSGSYVGELPPAIIPRQGDRWTRCTDMKGFIWYVDVDGGQWVADNPSYNDGTISDVSISYIFETAADYQASTTFFPVGKTIHLNDRDADFKIIAGTGTADGFGVIANNNTNQSAEYADPVATAKGFGAVGDGVTDDTLAIQAAIDFAGLIGASVDFGVGTFLLSTPVRNGAALSIPSGTVASGDADLTILLLDSDTSFTYGVFVENDAQDVTLSNFVIDGDRENRTVDIIYGLCGSNGCNNIKFSNITDKNASGRSITTNGSLTIDPNNLAFNFKLLHCKSINGADKCITTRGTLNVIITGCQALGNPKPSAGSSSLFEASESKNVVISNCNGDHINELDNTIGVRIVNNCEDIAVNGMVLRASRQNLFISRSNNVSVQNSVFKEGISACFISIADDRPDTADMDNIIVTGCAFYDVEAGLNAAVRVNIDPTLTNSINNVQVRDCLIRGQYGNAFKITENQGTISFYESQNLAPDAVGGNLSGDPSYDEAARNLSYQSGLIVLDENEAGYIEAPSLGRSGALELMVDLTASIYGKVTYNAVSGSESCELLQTISDRVQVSTGVLTGTTGNVGKITVSPDNGRIYIENRRAELLRILLTITCAR